MSPTPRILSLLDAFSRLCGRLLSWLMLGVMLFTCLVVVLRYVFGAGNIIFFQELVIYLNASAFMLAAAWCLERDGHVRVDVIYRARSKQFRAWVNVCGTLCLLLPVAVFLFFTSLEFALESWRIGEVSAEPGGIPAVFLLKSAIPLAALFLFLQGLAELIRNTISLIGADADG